VFRIWVGGGGVSDRGGEEGGGWILGRKGRAWSEGGVEGRRGGGRGVRVEGVVEGWSGGGWVKRRSFRVKRCGGGYLTSCL